MSQRQKKLGIALKYISLRKFLSIYFFTLSSNSITWRDQLFHGWTYVKENISAYLISPNHSNSQSYIKGMLGRYSNSTTGQYYFNEFHILNLWNNKMSWKYKLSMKTSWEIWPKKIVFPQLIPITNFLWHCLNFHPIIAVG